jgi:large subunit ribosomal protein L35
LLRFARIIAKPLPASPYRDFSAASILQGFPRRKICQFEAAPMPKQKTHKGTKKRFRLTAKGKAKHRQAGTSHLASRKSKKRRRNLRGTKVVSSTVLQQIHRALAASSG